MEKLNIVQMITKMDTIGGAQIHVRDIAACLRERGHTVHLITGMNENIHHGLEKITLHHLPHLVRELKPFSDVRAFFEVKKLLKTIKPDLVAAHSSKAGVIGRLAAWSLRIPVVFTAHGWSFTDGVPNPKRTFYRYVEKIVGQFSTGIIAVSEYDRNLAIRHKVIPSRKIICIQNGVHYSNDIQIKREEGACRLIMIARFAPPKMQLQLLETLYDLKHLEWSMHFVGDGPTKENARRYAEKQGIANKVHFEGWHRFVGEYLEKSDIFILLSKYEGLPLSILEAMRTGLPIIATNVGGVQEAVQADNGFLIGIDDPIDLKNAIERLITDKSLRKQMGKKSRVLFESKFTFGKMMDETVMYYTKLVGKEE